MSGEKTAEQRFAEIYPSLYPTIKAQEKFTEEDWKVGLDTEATHQEERLTELQKEFFAALRANAVDKMQSLIQRETAREDFKLSHLLSRMDYWQITNPLHPVQPHFFERIRNVIWTLIVLHLGENNPSKLLRWAIASYQPEETIEWCIDKVPELNIKDSHGVTFLHLACSFNQVSTVKALLSRWADPYKKDNNSKLPLDYACENNHPDIVRLVLESMKDKKCVSHLLLEKAEKYSPEITQLLRNATPSQFSTPPPSKLAEFVKKHGLNKQKLIFETSNHTIELTRSASTPTLWDLKLTATEPHRKKLKSDKEKSNYSFFRFRR